MFPQIPMRELPLLSPSFAADLSLVKSRGQSKVAMVAVVAALLLFLTRCMVNWTDGVGEVQELSAKSIHS